MSGIILVDVKAVGYCQKHVPDTFVRLTYRDGTPVKDVDIVCMECEE